LGIYPTTWDKQRERAKTTIS